MFEWFEKIKEVINMEAGKRNLLFGYLIFCGAIWYLYATNEKLQKLVIDGIQKERELVAEERRLCREQIVKNRTEYQKQFTEFTLASNRKIEEIAQENTQKAKRYLYKINKINEELKTIKDETDN